MPKDPDYNRQIQMELAKTAYSEGKYYAQRHTAFDACDRCFNADHEWLDTYDVMMGNGDHKYGHCFFTFSEVKGGTK